MNYAGMKIAVNNDIQSAGALETGRRLKVAKSDLPSQIPDGARVSVEPASFFKLRAGDYVVIRSRDGIALRRFVRSHIGPFTTLELATEHGTEKLPVKALMGRIIEVEAAGQKFDPNPTNWFSSMANRLTACGTRAPFCAA